MSRQHDLERSSRHDTLNSTAPADDITGIERKARRPERFDQSSDLIIERHRMTKREFWLSDHGLRMCICIWTSILIIGKCHGTRSSSLSTIVCYL